MALVEDRQDPSLEQLEAAFVAALDALDKMLVLRAQLDATFRDVSGNSGANGSLRSKGGAVL